MTNCLLHETDKPTTAEVGQLCLNHYSRLAAMLAEIATEYAALDANKSMQITQGRGGGLASERSPARLDVIAMRDARTAWDGDGSPLSALAVLSGWSSYVHDEHLKHHRPEQVGLIAECCRCRQPWPCTTAVATQTTKTVATEVQTLSTALTWVCEQDWVEDAYNEVRAVLGQLRAANGTADEKPAGRCPECGGPIYAATACCAHCGTCWTVAQLLELARPTDHNGQPMRTADEWAQHLGITAGAFRTRACRAKIRATPDGYYPTLDTAGRVTA